MAQTVFYFLVILFIGSESRIIVDKVIPGSSDGDLKVISTGVTLEDGQFGGYGGDAWSDEALALNGTITELEVRAGDSVDNIRTK